MYKFFRKTLIIFLIISITSIFYFVKATTENIEQESNEENIISDESLEEIDNLDLEENEESEDSKVPKSSNNSLQYSGVTVSNLNSYEEANLQLNNILCIILVSIGVLLILFAIAILIRLKN